MSGTFDLVIHGVDGSEWVVHGPRSHREPARLLAGKLGDFYEPPLEATYRGVVGQAGASYRGHRVLERYIPLRMAFYGDAWREVEARFRAAFAPDADATLTVTTHAWGSRWMRARLAEAPAYEDGLDPGVNAAMVKLYSLVAGDPFWYAGEVHDEFVFDGSNWAGDTVTVDNPTDVPAWPAWVLTAPAKFGLPDIDLTAAHPAQRFVYLPFQPHGRTVRVDTDPLAETIVANDATLMWAQLNGQFFDNPIPPRTPPTELPVYVDPFPLLGLPLPPQWRMWIAMRLRELVAAMGLQPFLALTPEDIGERIEAWMRESVPEWVPLLSDDLVAELTGDAIAEIIRGTYGRVANIAGATAQVRVQRRWQRPWG